MTGTSPRVTVHEDRDGPDVVVWLDNGLLRLGLVPGLGARLLSVRLAGREMLYRNSRLVDERLHRTGAERDLGPLDETLGSWRNYGGDKTWPAPQGWDGPEQWAGPPDPVLDSGAYAYEVECTADTATVIARSAPDPRTGLRITRRITLACAEARYTLDIGFDSVATHPVRWSIWNVTQVAGAPGSEATRDGVYVGIDDPATVELFAATGVPACVHARPDVLHIPAQDIVGKLGFPGATGWLANAASGLVLCQSWPVTAGRAYPDGGSRAEVWLEHPVTQPLESLGGLRPSDRVVELEALGPLMRLDPGRCASLRVDCGVAACPTPIVGHGPHGPISAPLSLDCLPDRERAVHVTARAGSFVAGDGALVWQDAAGRDLRSEQLGPIAPTEPVIVETTVTPPARAAAVELRVASHSARSAVLAGATLEERQS